LPRQIVIILLAAGLCMAAYSATTHVQVGPQ